VNSKTILIVDDQKPVREMIAAYLTEAGFNTLLADDGAQALLAVGERLPDLVVADVNMPNMNGLQLAGYLRADPVTARIPILLLSALAQSKDVLAGYAEGADEYVTKPIELAVLLAKVKSLLSRHQRGPAEVAPPARKLIAFVHAKGGVGTTALAVNLAAALANGPGRPRVCLVDLNPMFGAAAMFLGLTPESSLMEALTAGGGELEDRALDALPVTHVSGLRLVVACRRADGELRDGPAIVRPVLERLRDRFDVVVADTGIGLPERATSLLDLTDMVCVVSSPDRASLNATRELLDLLDDMPRPVRRRFLVLNRASIGRELGKAGVLLGHEPDAIISADELYVASADAGQPLVMTQRGDPAETELARMAESVRKILGMESAVPSSELSAAGARQD
jgi:CheY-like chemotaxis protein/MinD-like ATPase involved in chromosome partitioning or flagellar assembly